MDSTTGGRQFGGGARAIGRIGGGKVAGLGEFWAGGKETLEVEVAGGEGSACGEKSAKSGKRVQASVWSGCG
jgi:hypothetical protein